MKTCSKCKLEKNESEFHPRKRGGHYSYCRPCLHRKQMFRWKKVKEKAIQFKGGKCMDCNLIHPRPEIYQFHHLNPDEKDVSWNKLRIRSWEKIIKELDKCVLLCAHCHIIRHSIDVSNYED